MGGGVGGTMAQGFAIGPDGGWGVAEAGVGEAEIGVGLGEVGFEGDGLFEGREGLGPALLTEEGEGELDPAVEGISTTGEVLAEAGFGFGTAALLEVQAAEEKEDFGIFGGFVEEFGQVAIGVVEAALGEEGGDAIGAAGAIALELANLAKIGVRPVGRAGHRFRATGKIDGRFVRAFPGADLAEEHEGRAGGVGIGEAGGEGLGGDGEPPFGQPDAGEFESCRRMMGDGCQNLFEMGRGFTKVAMFYQGVGEAEGGGGIVRGGGLGGVAEVGQGRFGIVGQLEESDEVAPTNGRRVTVQGRDVAGERFRKELGGMEDLAKGSPSGGGMGLGEHGLPACMEGAAEGGVQGGGVHLGRG